MKKGPYTLKIHTLSNSWHDKDHVMMHTMFQLLVDFIEDECSPGIVNWNTEPKHKAARKEMQSLYTWWKVKRPARKNILDFTKHVKQPGEGEMFVGGKVYPDDARKKYAAYFRALDRYNKTEEKWTAEDQQNLHRLIEIRKYMWT